MTSREKELCLEAKMILKSIKYPIGRCFVPYKDIFAKVGKTKGNIVFLREIYDLNKKK